MYDSKLRYLSKECPSTTCCLVTCRAQRTCCKGGEVKDDLCLVEVAGEAAQDGGPPPLRMLPRMRAICLHGAVDWVRKTEGCVVTGSVAT